MSWWSARATRLVLALWLTKLGAKARIVDKTSEPGATSRALAVLSSLRGARIRGCRSRPSWAPQYAHAGLARDALYLLRPDTYVGLADETGSADVLQSYLRRGPMAN